MKGIICIGVPARNLNNKATACTAAKYIKGTVNDSEKEALALERLKAYAVKESTA